MIIKMEVRTLARHKIVQYLFTLLVCIGLCHRVSLSEVDVILTKAYREGSRAPKTIVSTRQFQVLDQRCSYHGAVLLELQGYMCVSSISMQSVVLKTH